MGERFLGARPGPPKPGLLPPGRAPSPPSGRPDCKERMSFAQTLPAPLLEDPPHRPELPTFSVLCLPSRRQHPAAPGNISQVPGAAAGWFSVRAGWRFTRTCTPTLHTHTPWQALPSALCEEGFSDRGFSSNKHLRKLSPAHEEAKGPPRKSPVSSTRFPGSSAHARSVGVGAPVVWAVCWTTGRPAVQRPSGSRRVPFPPPPARHVTGGQGLRPRPARRTPVPDLCV